MSQLSVPAPITIGPREFAWGARTYIMGIVNVTPDSFSGDGLALDVEAAVRQAIQMREDGADIIDVGGESTRPGAAELPAEEEMRRVLPVVRRLAKELVIPVSVDTYKADVARAALEAGAHMVNDIHGFRRDPEIARVAAEAGVPAVAMHNQRGRDFHDTTGDIVEGLLESLRVAREAGLPEERVIVDPGFGFGWTVEQNLEMLRRLPDLRVLGRPILAGASRKSAIGAVLGDLPAGERLEGTAASVAVAIARGVDIVRVHDVREMARVVRVADAIARGVGSEGGLPA